VTGRPSVTHVPGHDRALQWTPGPAGADQALPRRRSAPRRASSLRSSALRAVPPRTGLSGGTSVTHVPGQICYPCAGLHSLDDAHLRAELPRLWRVDPPVVGFLPEGGGRANADAWGCATCAIPWEGGAVFVGELIAGVLSRHAGEWVHFEEVEV
jgi:hypothetical protein